jgi:hypothetical protein
MRWPFALALAAASLVASACGGSSTSPSGSTGTLRMMLTDSPFTDAKSLFITFSEVDTHKSDTAEGAWSKVEFPNGATRTCDLKKLQTAQDVLGLGALPVGHYTQVRLVVRSAVIYFDTAATGDACGASLTAPPGRSANVTIPSGEVKLNREFDVSASTTTMMVLDFDGDKSVHETSSGQFTMSPVIAVVGVQ